jgi:hypothetical protein
LIEAEKESLKRRSKKSSPREKEKVFSGGIRRALLFEFFSSSFTFEAKKKKAEKKASLFFALINLPVSLSLLAAPSSRLSSRLCRASRREEPRRQHAGGQARLGHARR